MNYSKDLKGIVMSRVLFVTDSYGWKATANGICVEEVASYFVKQGDEVHVMCFRRKGEEKCELVNGIYVHRIKMNPINRWRAVHEIYDVPILVKKMALFTYKWLNRLQSMIFLYWYPMRTPVFTLRYAREMGKLHERYNFDVVVMSYAPFEAAGAGWIFKRKYSDVYAVLYILDSFSNLIPRFFLSKEWQDKKGWQWEQRFYRIYDLILNLRCHDKHYAQSRYEIYRSKMKSTDIPHMSEDILPKKCDIKRDSNRLNFLYAGLIRPVTGPYAMCMLERLSKSIDLVINMYTRSNEEILGGQLLGLENKIVWNGFVTREEVLKRECEADVLLSMGNPQSDFIPSKTFEMILTGKRIIHFYNIENDPVNAYLKRYPNACLININHDIELNYEKIQVFLKKPYVEIDRKELLKEYYENTPEFTYLQIKEAM